MSTLRQRPRRVPAKSDPTPQGLPKLDSRWQLAKPQFDGEWVRLTELCKPKQWKTIPRASLKQDGYPVYGANGVIGYSDSYNHENETILVGCRGTCGQINVCRPRSYVTGNAMCLDELSEDVDLRYLEQFLRAFDFKAIISGSSQPQITRQGLSKVLVPVRPLDEQRTIADNLGKLSQLENLCERQLSAFDDLVKSRFVEMFGDPIYNEKGYPEKRLGELLEIARGGSPRPIKDYLTNDPEGINWIKIGDTVEGSRYINSTAEKIKPEGKAKSREVKAGDFLLSNSMSFGRPYILNIDGCIHDGWLVLSDSRKRFNKAFLCELLGSSALKAKFSSSVRGGVVSNLNIDLVASTVVPYPPLALQQQFADFVARVDKLGFDVQQQIEKLETLKQSLMQEYFG